MPTLTMYLFALTMVSAAISQLTRKLAPSECHHVTQHVRGYAPVLLFSVCDHYLRSWHEGTPCWPANEWRRDRVGFFARTLRAVTALTMVSAAITRFPEEIHEK